MIIIGVSIILIVGAIVAFTLFRKHQIEKLFSQVFVTSKQVPKQKKKSFLLLMFKESMTSAKKKSKSSNVGSLNNPKYLEFQLIQMSSILKDTSKVKDKSVKNALRLLNDYLAWEKKKFANEKQATKGKAS